MANKFQTAFCARNIRGGSRLAAAYRKQFDIGLDGEPRKRSKKAPPAKRANAEVSEVAGVGSTKTCGGRTPLSMN
jgi:hypothetical protein